MFRARLLCLSLWVALSSTAVEVNALPTGYHQKDLITGLDAVSSSMLPDGRVLAIEKFGLVHLIKNGQVVQKPFLNWEANTISRFEKGMMVILADPDFATNGYIYVWYSNKRIGGNGQDQVSRFTVKGDTVDTGSEKLIISLGDSGNNYHHGSGLTVGPDGKLWIASGCRGDVNDGPPGPANASNKNRVEGKMLRVNIPEGDIPSDNPFYTTNTGDARAVYYWGLRNPFTQSWRGSKLWFSEVQSSSTDDKVEEGGPAGTDYGFQNRGGQAPLWTSSSANANGRAMIGSLWYSGKQFSADYQDKYYFGNVAAGTLWYYDINHSGSAKVFGNFNCPIDVKMDPAGAMYVTTRCQTEDVRYTTGMVTKIWYGDTEPTVALTPEQQSSIKAADHVSWSCLPGGKFLVDVLKSGQQTVELHDVGGRLLAQASFSEPGKAEFSVHASGTGLLVWKSGATRAVTKVVLQ